jgi:hypothetical protein
MIHPLRRLLRIVRAGPEAGARSDVFTTASYSFARQSLDRRASAKVETNHRLDRESSPRTKVPPEIHSPIVQASSRAEAAIEELAHLTDFAFG